jgi:hypothetical protein
LDGKNDEHPMNRKINMIHPYSFRLACDAWASNSKSIGHIRHCFASSLGRFQNRQVLKIPPLSVDIAFQADCFIL